MNKFAPLVRAVSRVNNARNMSGHGVPAHFKPIRQVCEENKNHMNFMPVPQGSWQEAYATKNSQNNMLLLGSLAACIATFGVLYSTGCIYLHGAPPSYLKKN